MQATTFFSSSAAGTLLRRPKSHFSSPPPRGKKPHILAMAASSSSNSRSRGSSNSNKARDFGGRLVDENMIVLRMRIQETKLLEARNDELPSHWMEWEQNYYQDYIQDVLEAMGLLQNYFMHVRPCFALGIIALVTFTVLISSGVALFQAVHIAHMIISSFHFS